MRDDLQRLADLYGVQTSYHDLHGRIRQASEEAVLAMLRCLGAPLDSVNDAPEAMNHRLLELWDDVCEPVIVVQEQDQPALKIRVAESEAEGSIRARICTEQGQVQTVEGTFGQWPTSARQEVAGRGFVEKMIRFEEPLSCGYHDARMEWKGGQRESLILCPPRRAWECSERAWGVFAPLYALHSERSVGGGDFHDLETLVDWVGSLGASVIGTLPLLPAFLDELFDPSPYAPVSRMFWNEFYLDVERLVGEASCEAAGETFSSQAFRAEADEFGREPLVDYGRQMALKRRVLGALADRFFGNGGEDDREFQGFVETHPRVRDYAEFRAATELSRKPWQDWPEAGRDGSLSATNFREADARYHVYVQWRCFQQMASLGDKARALGVGLYLDLPLGVHRSGYDAWREREVFLPGCSLGAPPDIMFTEGQQWGISPLHPAGLRRQRYRYLIDCVRHHMAHAGALRIDHVMGLHRVYCVPDGSGSGEGVYVRYRPEELYAILALESTRAQTIVVGEDLGIVPDEVRETMGRTGVSRIHVFQYELAGDGRNPFVDVPKEVVASVNTHDMPMFAVWWKGEDIDDQVAKGHLSPEEAVRVRELRRRACDVITVDETLRGGGDGRSDDGLAVLSGILGQYAASRAAIVLVNLEDLWLELEPQNVPGTGYERPNWRRKFRYSLEAMKERANLLRVLRRVDIERRGQA